MRNFIKTLRQQMQDGELQLVAASLAFSTAFALVPFFAVTFSALQAIGGLEVIYPKVEGFLLSQFKDNFGNESTQVLKKIISRILEGKTGTAGAIALVLSCMRLIHDMGIGIHRVWNIKSRRSVLHRMLIYWGVLLATPFALAFYVAFINSKAVEPVLTFMPNGFRIVPALFIFLFLLYKLVPNTKVHWRPAALGAAMATLLLAGLNATFKIVAHSLFNYNRVYGSLAALPLLLLTILIVWQFVLFGVAVTATVQKQHG